jgi:CTP:molybdopterin cytidylyltransferase MocA
MSTVAGLVLAAGGGRRYGMPKALVEYEGSLLVERAVRTARAVCDPVLVVLGAQAVDVWRTADLDAALVTLVDMPGMTPEALRAVAAHAAPDALATATYDGVRGHPVLLGREHWAGVAATATGDEGARRYLAGRAVTEVDCTGLADPTDLDVPPGGVPSAP